MYLADNGGAIDTAADAAPSQLIGDVDSATDKVQTLDFYAIEATPTGVTFAIKNPIEYPAGSKEIIEFQFTANATPIRDGYVRVQLPSDLDCSPTPH